VTDRSAVFLDRDGVVVEHVAYLAAPEQVALVPGALDAIAELNRAGVAAVLVTNQSVVARGGCSETELRAIHETLAARLRPARLDAIYYCPHLPPDAGEPERPPYRVTCDCRKPRPGLLLRAARDLDLDPSRSIMIGDSTSDAEAGRRAGMATALVRTGVAGEDARYAPASLSFDDLAEAVAWWLRHRPERSAAREWSRVRGGSS
jgi:D-glycero-D-manno-heptose 1,7-bisphosphate phosphatase